jgi:hypothetical protein
MWRESSGKALDINKFLWRYRKCVSMRSVIALFLIVLSASSLILVNPAEPVKAQISPSIPEFSLKLDDRSYDVPPTSTTDPNTGKTVNVTEGYHVEKRFIDVVIKNPNPYSFYGVVNESIVKLYYNIRVKEYSQDWEDATVTPSNLAPSDSEYTTVKFGLGGVNPDPGGWSIWLGSIAAGSQVDFQVQGVDGFYTKLTEEDPICWRLTEFNVFNETGRSGWSTTQTITIPADWASASPTQTSPQQTEPAASATPISSAFALNPITLTLVVIVLVIAASLGALLYLRRKRGSLIAQR